MKSADKIDVRQIRRKMGLNQSQFWSKLGVTQSGGSRYESGRNIPKPVQTLLRLVHIEKVDIDKVRKDDIEVLDFLRAHNQTLLRDLKKQAKLAAKSKKAD